MTEPRDNDPRRDPKPPKEEFTIGFYFYAAFMLGVPLWASIRMLF
jgi:hypothetical protein